MMGPGGQAGRSPGVMVAVGGSWQVSDIELASAGNS